MVADVEHLSVGISNFVATNSTSPSMSTQLYNFDYQ